MQSKAANSQNSRASLDVQLAAAGVLLLVATTAASYFFAHDRGDALTRNTVRLALTWYAAAVLFMLKMQPRDWSAVTPRGRIARWCWFWGLVSYLVHVAMAFHYFHRWSHAHAYEHNRQVGGIGEGIYVSYLFTALWIADCVWWLAWPRSYAARSPWIDCSLHAFMLFIAFNATVVFEAGVIRWAGLATFAALAVAWISWRVLPKVRRN